MFSSLKLIKSEKRCCLSEDRLDDLLRISVEGPPLCNLDAERAIIYGGRISGEELLVITANLQHKVRN